MPAIAFPKPPVRSPPPSAIPTPQTLAPEAAGTRTPRNRHRCSKTPSKGVGLVYACSASDCRIVYPGARDGYRYRRGLSNGLHPLRWVSCRLRGQELLIAVERRSADSVIVVIVLLAFHSRLCCASLAGVSEFWRGKLAECSSPRVLWAAHSLDRRQFQQLDGRVQHVA